MHAVYIVGNLCRCKFFFYGFAIQTFRRKFDYSRQCSSKATPTIKKSVLVTELSANSAPCEYFPPLYGNNINTIGILTTIRVVDPCAVYDAPLSLNSAVG